ncbi:MAG TPA: MerR family transcriptional regulator [Solirubrobacteraceae bacterium]|nr:MerR family transcriptional regulator [Solirubrobacteraceae bacterium]
MSQTRQSLRIGDVARELSITPRTIRYYEELGLLAAEPGRRSGSHRTYAPADVDRLREVLRLKQLLGVSVEELRTLLTAEQTRAEVRAELRREDVTDDRRRELLTQSATHLDRQLELVRRRRDELERLYSELTDTRRKVRRRLRELEARATGDAAADDIELVGGGT